MLANKWHFFLILFMLVKSMLCKVKIYKYKAIPGILGTLFEIFQNFFNIHFVHKNFNCNSAIHLLD